MSASAFLLILSFGITFNLLMVSHMLRHRRREIRENYRRQDEVAALAAEAVRLLGVNQDALLAATNRVADRLLAADAVVADKLEIAAASGLLDLRETLLAQTVLAEEAAEAREASQGSLDDIRDVVTEVAPAIRPEAAS